MRIAINGFGRIGRCLLRALQEQNLESRVEVAVINSPGNPRTLAHLYKYDSTYGPATFDVSWEPDAIISRGRRIPCINEPDPSKTDWSAFKIDLVVDCSGRAKEREVAQAHLAAGAPRVLVSAPSHDPDVTLIPGCNLESYDPSKHRIVSMGSCTTNCLCPTLKVLHNNFIVENGFATAIHSFTSDQRLLDGSHEDLRRARAAGQSLIPTKTGASQAVASALPELRGKIRCAAVRTPTASVSLLDLTVLAQKRADEQGVNDAFQEASEGSLRGILAVSKHPLVSVDYKKDTHSSTVDALSTSVSGRMIRTLAWYDNEWAYSMRLIDTALLMGGIGSQESKPIPKVRRLHKQQPRP